MAKGDQIYVYRPFFNKEGVYQHHGIDCGDGSVIHYRKPSEVVELTSMATFSWNNPVYLREYSQGFCFIPDVVVERAHSRLGEQQYNFLFNNCEHFATWCKTGISDSKQLRDFMPAIAKLKIEDLYQPLQQAFQSTDNNNAHRMLNKALGDIRDIWDKLQPQYQDSLKEIDTWQQVAEKALVQNREDLARAALEKKYNYKQRARQLAEKLDELAKMTETLLTNNHNIH